MYENIFLLFLQIKSLPKFNINLGQFSKAYRCRLQAFANCRVMKKIIGHQFQRRRTDNFIISMLENTLLEELDFFSPRCPNEKGVCGKKQSPISFNNGSFNLDISNDLRQPIFLIERPLQNDPHIRCNKHYTHYNQ